MLYSHKTSLAAEYELTLDTVYNCRCYMFIRWYGYEVECLLQAVFLEILPNCIRGEECSSSSDQLHTSHTNANLHSSTAICIRLNSSKIHSSNNNLTICAAPFILPHSPPASGPACLSASSASHSTPSQLQVLHLLHTLLRALTSYSFSGSKIQLTNENPPDLPMIPLFVVFFKKILKLIRTTQ